MRNNGTCMTHDHFPKSKSAHENDSNEKWSTGLLWMRLIDSSADWQLAIFLDLYIFAFSQAKHTVQHDMSIHKLKSLFDIERCYWILVTLVLRQKSSHRFLLVLIVLTRLGQIHPERCGRKWPHWKPLEDPGARWGKSCQMSQWNIHSLRV